MEINKEINKDTSTKLFTILLVIMLTIVLLIGGVLLWVSHNGIRLFYQFIIFFSIILSVLVVVVIILTIIAIILLGYNKRVPIIVKTIMELFINMSYPIIMLLGKIIGYDKNAIRRAYTSLNNKLVFSVKYNFKGEEILILTPHCIQKTFCPHKITNDTNNCKRCGQCNVDKLLDLKEEYGIGIKIVTGGTLARKIILDVRPKALIAIACERDLFSGLMDVKGLPVLAIINKRPEGPCVNTEVDLLEVEKAIMHFIKE